jgi:hypothetical protein
LDYMLGFGIGVNRDALLQYTRETTVLVCTGKLHSYRTTVDGVRSIDREAYNSLLLDLPGIMDNYTSLVYRSSVKFYEKVKC